MKTNVTNKNLETVTKQDIMALTENMDQKFSSTKQDIERLATSTKKDIERLDKDIESLSEVMSERFEVVESELKNLNNKILTMQDKILKKLDDLETDNTVGTEQYRRVQITLDVHEKRIKSLENAKN